MKNLASNTSGGQSYSEYENRTLTYIIPNRGKYLIFATGSGCTNQNASVDITVSGEAVLTYLNSPNLIAGAYAVTNYNRLILADCNGGETVNANMWASNALYLAVYKFE